MSDLPDGWEIALLSDIAEVRLGRQRSPKNHTGDNMKPYLRAANVGWDGLKLDDVKEMNFTAEEFKTYELVPGDILLSEASGSPDEVGKPAIWRGERLDVCFQNTLIRVRSRGVLPEYLLRYFQYQARIGAFGRAARGVGIHHLGAATLTAWQIPIPPLDEQMRIVERLDEAMSLIDSATVGADRSLRRMDLLLRSVLSAAVRGRLAEPVEPSTGVQITDILQERSSRWTKGTSYKEPVGAEPLDYPVPSHWGVLSLEAVTDPIRTIAYGILMPKVKDGGTVPYIEVKDLAGGVVDATALHKTSLQLHEEFKRTELAKGDLVLAIRGSYDRVALVPVGAVGGNVSRDVARIAPLPGLLPEFLRLYLASPEAIAYRDQHARGVAVRGVNIGSLRQMPVPIPPVDEQKRIVMAAEEYTSVVAAAQDTVAMALRKAHSLRVAVLESAFSGRLVHQDPAEQSANVLLDRIRAAGDQAPKARTTRKAKVSG